MAEQVRIFEMGPRDGLQNESTPVSLADKTWFIENLSTCGYSDIEIGAFVRPDRIPQMADSERLAETFKTKPSLKYWTLVPNQKGLDRALAVGVQKIAIFTAATDGFNTKNIGMTVKDSLVQYQDVVRQAKAAGLEVRGYLSTSFGCPFDGRVPAAQAASVIRALDQMGCDEISIGDTIGVASPRQVKDLLAVFKGEKLYSKLAMHFHDTRGTALANAAASLELGIRKFDSSAAGLGGCPFAPGATGNLSTEDLVYLLQEMGIETGIDLPKLCEVSLEMMRRMGKKTYASRYLKSFESTKDRQGPRW
jgi:hydroxymethylglutaryl-CoA lyase